MQLYVDLRGGFHQCVLFVLICLLFGIIYNFVILCCMFSFCGGIVYVWFSSFNCFKNVKHDSEVNRIEKEHATLLYVLALKKERLHIREQSKVFRGFCGQCSGLGMVFFLLLQGSVWQANFFYRRFSFFFCYPSMQNIDAFYTNNALDFFFCYIIS